MKKIVPVIGILLALGAIFVVLGLALGASTGIYWDARGVHAGDRSNTERPMNISELDLVPFTDININMINHDIEFVISDRYGLDLVNSNNTDINWNLQSGRLTVTEKSRTGSKFSLDFGFFRRMFKDGSYLKIYLPADAALKDVSIKNVSGKIKLSGFSCSLLDINIISGGTEIAGIVADRFAIDGVSGRLAMRDCQVGTANIGVISGNSSILGLRSGGLSLRSVSGRVEISGELLGYNEINSISGEVRLQILDKAEDYRKQFNLRSGHLRINGQSFSRNYSESTSAPHSLKVDTVSGGVTVDFSQPIF